MAVAFQRFYNVRAEFSPTTLTAETVFFAMRNTQVGTVLHLLEFQPQILFTGVALGGVSTFGCQRAQASSGAATGGTSLIASKGNSSMLDPDVDVRMSNSGLTGLTPDSIDRVYLCGIPNQPGIGVVAPPALRYEDENPLSFVGGESIILVAHTALASGVRLAAHFKFAEGT